MKILIVNAYAHITGGADRHCLDLTAGLRASGHDVLWLSTSSPDNIESRGAFIPARVTNRSKTDLSPRAAGHAACGALWNTDAYKAAHRLLRDADPDIVHVHKAYVQLSVAPIIAAERANVPIIQTVHDYEFMAADAFTAIPSALDRRGATLPDRILNTMTFPIRRTIHAPRVNRWIAVSRATAAQYESVGIACDVIPNFVAPSYSCTEAPDFYERVGVIYAGRLEDEKGVRDVLRVAHGRPETPFTIAGDGARLDIVEAAASDYPNVTYLGVLSGIELQAAFRKARVCVMPSRWEEPGPLSCLEAMAAGTPVVAYPSGGLAEYVQDANAGIVTSERDPTELAAAITRLHSEPSAWAAASNSGLQAISGRHSLARYLRHVVGVYESVIG